jgi:hypothetical protein
MLGRMNIAQSAAVRRHSTATGSSQRDNSAWSLIGANLLSLAVGVYEGWTLIDLMLVYWLQSVIIGVSYFARMLALDKFSTENFTINDRAVAPTRETKIQTACFFALHYGLFHVVYLIFILSETSLAALVDPQLWICALAFAGNHLYSYRYNRDADRRGTPNIGTLMFTPYLRILPMHFTIVFGLMSSSLLGLVFFGTLKTAADVAMHAVEHRVLGRT